MFRNLRFTHRNPTGQLCRYWCQKLVSLTVLSGQLTDDSLAYEFLYCLRPSRCSLNNPLFRKLWEQRRSVSQTTGLEENSLEKVQVRRGNMYVRIGSENNPVAFTHNKRGSSSGVFRTKAIL